LHNMKNTRVLIAGVNNPAIIRSSNIAF
jgi:hypothetical protein